MTVSNAPPRLARGARVPSAAGAAALALALLLSNLPARAQSAVASGCVAALAVPEATFVALAGDRMLRLLVESSLEKATLVLNRIEGHQLVDRRYWNPIAASVDCAGVRTLDYLEEATSEPVLRLVIQVPERIVREGLPRPLTVLRATLSAAGGLSATVDFEEVVLSRTVGGR